MSPAEASDLARWEAELAGRHIWEPVPEHGGWSCLICSTLITSGDDIRIHTACPGPAFEVLS